MPRQKILLEIQIEGIKQGLISGRGPTGVAAAAIDIAEVDDLSVNTLTAGTIVASAISTFEFTTTFISNFAVKSGDDVQFVGSTSDNFFLWDSSLDTLYLENATLKTSDCFIHLNNPSDENLLTSSEADRDNGIIFRYFDNSPGIGASESKEGFFGYKDDSERFTFIPNVAVGDCIVTAITEPVGDFEMKDVFLRNVVNEDGTRNMGITSASNINMAALNLDVTATTDITLSAGTDVNIIAAAACSPDRCGIPSLIGAIDTSLLRWSFSA